MPNSDAGGIGAAETSGRIEVELPNRWRIEIVGDTENGGIWRLTNTDGKTIASRALPPHAYWPNNRYVAAYTVIDTIRTLFIKSLEMNLRADGCKDLKHYIKWYGRKYSIKGYTYLHLAKEGMHRPRYIFQQLLKTLGIYRYYIELRELNTNRFRIELYPEPKPIDTWFLRGLAITDGNREKCSFASPKNELLGAVLANCSAKIALDNIKLWYDDIKVTLKLRISEKPFKWVNEVLYILTDEKTRKDLELSKLLPRTPSEGLELLAGMVTGDGFVNRLTKALTVSFSFKTWKGRAVMKILKYLIDLGLFRPKSGMERIESHRELKLGIPYEMKLELASHIPYYKGYRIVAPYYDLMLAKPRRRHKPRESSNRTVIASQWNTLSVNASLEQIINEIISRYIPIINYATIEHNPRSGSRLRILCLEREPCKNLAEELKRIGLNPVTSYNYKKTFTIRKGKELVAYVLEQYGKLRLDENTQRIYNEWLQRIQP